MSDVEILSEKPMNAYQVRDELAKVKKRDEELNFRANKTEDYLNKVLEHNKIDDLYKKLEDLSIPRIKEVHLHKLVEVCPETLQDVKVVLQGYTINVTQENMKKIAETIKGFVS